MKNPQKIAIATVIAAGIIAAEAGTAGASAAVVERNRTGRQITSSQELVNAVQAAVVRERQRPEFAMAPCGPPAGEQHL